MPVSILSAFCPLFVGFKTWKHLLPKAILHLQIFYDSNHANTKKHFARIDHPGSFSFGRFSVYFL